MQEQLSVNRTNTTVLNRKPDASSPLAKKSAETTASPISASVQPQFGHDFSRIALSAVSAMPLQREALPEEELQMKVDPDATVQREAAPEEELQMKAEGSATVQRAEGGTQSKSNPTGLPDNLKTGVENLSGMSMDDVNVHYNSSAPREVGALAYAQGTDIHVASGQEQHLPHEAWHVVQQKQGRVQPTFQMKMGVSINDDAGLEHEADVMGAKALSDLSANEKA